MRWKQRLGALSAAMLAGACASFYLSQIDTYTQAVRDWLAEAEEAIAAAGEELREGDVAAAKTYFDRASFACRQIADLKAYGALAVRSYFGQEASQRALNEQRRRDYERLCVLPESAGETYGSRDRLDVERGYLEQYEGELQRFCGCDSPAAPGPIDLDRDCSISAAAFEQAFNRDDAAQFGSLMYGVYGVMSGIFTYGIGTALSGAGAGVIYGITEEKVRNVCTALHGIYQGQYDKVEGLEQTCAGGPPRPGEGATSGAELDDLIQGALASAESYGGSGASALYGEAHHALDRCEALLGEIPSEPLGGDAPTETGFEQEPEDVDDMGSTEPEPGEIEDEYTPPEDYVPPDF